MHRDHVPEVPPPFLPLGSTSIAANQGMVLYSDSSKPTDRTLTDVQIITLQGHPEFTESISEYVIVARSGTGIFSADLAADARKRNAELDNDGVKIARVFWRILGVSS